MIIRAFKASDTPTRHLSRSITSFCALSCPLRIWYFGVFNIHIYLRKENSNFFRMDIFGGGFFWAGGLSVKSLKMKLNKELEREKDLIGPSSVF